MIAVTGAAGFIGSNLAHRLASLGHELVCVDHPLSAAAAENFVGLAQFLYLRHDLFLEKLSAGALEVEAVFHLGACSSTTETDADYLRRNNVEYSQRLWSWCAANRRPFIYASSAATYGDGEEGFDDRTLPDKLTPLNLYGKSKNDFDAWVYAEIAAGRPTPPGWAGLKFFNVYGPRERHKGPMASVVWQAYKQIRQTGKMRLFRSNDPAYPDGGQLRDFVFVDDCVDHMLWLRQHPQAAGIYNSGTGRARTFLDLVKAVFTALKLEPQIEFIEMPASLSKQYQNYTQADMSKLRAAGYDAPSTSLEEGVDRYVRFLKDRYPEV